MRERVTLVGGELSVESGGAGTTVSATFAGKRRTEAKSPSALQRPA
jgi:signal transduction histidine kinase